MKTALSRRTSFTALTGVVVIVIALVVPLIFNDGTVYASGNPPVHVNPASSGSVDCLHGCHPGLKHGVTRNARTYRAPNGQYITASSVVGSDPIYMVHGLHPTPVQNGFSCTAGLWGPVQSYLQGTHPGLGSDTLRWSGPIYKVGYYNEDYNCDVYLSTYNNPHGNFPATKCDQVSVYGFKGSPFNYSNVDPTVGTNDEPIEHIACELAWQIWWNQSQWGQNVKIVAHSMGGLIVRYMINQVQTGNSHFPPYLFVSDVVTFSTPNDALYGWQTTVTEFGCADCFESNEMWGGSNFINYADQHANHPDAGGGGTDWTMLGSLGADPLDWDYQATFMSNSNGLSNNHRIGYGSNTSPSISCNGQSEYPNGYDHGSYMVDTCDAFDAPYFYCDGCSRDQHSWFDFTNAAPHSLHEMLFAFTYYNW